MSREQERIREQLSAYADGELSREQSRQVESAVQADPLLAAELKKLRAIRSLVYGLPREAAPDDLAARVQSRAERARLLAVAGQRAGRPTSWYAARLAAAAIVVIAVGVGAAVVAWVMTPSYLERNKTRLAQTPPPAKHDTPATGTPARFADKVAEPTAPMAKPTTPGPPMVGKGDASVTEGNGLDAKLAAGAVMNLIINTEDVAKVQKQVELVFDYNGIRLLDESDFALADNTTVAKPGDEVAETPAEQIRYEVVIPSRQLKQIVSDLNEIQGRQNVAQAPMEIIPPEAAERPELARMDELGKAAEGGGRESVHRSKGRGGDKDAELARLEPKKVAPEAPAPARAPAPAAATATSAERKLEKEQPAGAPGLKAPDSPAEENGFVSRSPAKGGPPPAKGGYVGKGMEPKTQALNEARPAGGTPAPTTRPGELSGQAVARRVEPPASQAAQPFPSQQIAGVGQSGQRGEPNARDALQQELQAYNMQYAVRSRTYAFQQQAQSAPASAPSQQGTRNRTQLASARLVGSAPANEARQLVITINSVLPAPAQRR